MFTCALGINAFNEELFFSEETLAWHSNVFRPLIQFVQCYYALLSLVTKLIKHLKLSFIVADEILV